MHSDRSARRRRLMIATQPEGDDRAAPAWQFDDEVAPPREKAGASRDNLARRKKQAPSGSTELETATPPARLLSQPTHATPANVSIPSDSVPSAGNALAKWKDPSSTAPAFPMARAPRGRGGEIARLRGDLVPSEMPRPIELCVSSQLTGESEIVRVDSSVVAIGRGSQCDIRLMHPDVSRRHACIQVLQTGVLCYDLGSRTGVLWNGEARQVGWITPRQAAEIGPFEIRLATEEDHAVGLLPSARESWDESVDSKPDAWLTAPTDSEPGNLTFGFEVDAKERRGMRPEATVPQFVPLRNALTLVGRGKECEVQLRDQGISRVHSSVLRTAEDVWLMDLAGRGGVRVNGQAISQARLRPGDEVECGSHRLLFVARHMVEQPVRAESAESAQSAKRAVQSVSVDGYVSESLVLAMVETFADMQRQMRDQFQVQMDFMVDMVESLRQETRDDIRSELANLKAIGEQIREAQSRLAMRPVWSESDATPSPNTRASSESSASNARDEPHPAQAERGPETRETPRHYPRHFDEADQSGDGIADHLFVTRQLRELEKERETSWDRLVRMMNPGH